MIAGALNTEALKRIADCNLQQHETEKDSSRCPYTSLSRCTENLETNKGSQNYTCTVSVKEPGRFLGLTNIHSHAYFTMGGITLVAAVVIRLGQCGYYGLSDDELNRFTQRITLFAASSIGVGYLILMAFNAHQSLFDGPGRAYHITSIYYYLPLFPVFLIGLGLYFPHSLVVAGIYFLAVMCIGFWGMAESEGDQDQYDFFGVLAVTICMVILFVWISGHQDWLLRNTFILFNRLRNMKVDLAVKCEDPFQLGLFASTLRENTMTLFTFNSTNRRRIGENMSVRLLGDLPISNRPANTIQAG